MRSAEPRGRALAVRPSRSNMNPLLRFATGLVVALVALEACGGGGSAGSSSPSTDSDTGPGQAAFSIVWPSRGRSVPVTANSVMVAILRSGKTLRTGLTVRPSDGSPSVASFANLPLGTLDVQMSSFASTDGTGVALSVGTMSMTPVVGVPTPVAIPMDPVAATLSLSTSTVAVPQNATTGLSVSALDAAGNAMSIADDAVRWTSDAPSVASVTGSGTQTNVTGVSVGSTTIHATLTRADGTTLTIAAFVNVTATGGSVTVK